MHSKLIKKIISYAKKVAPNIIKKIAKKYIYKAKKIDGLIFIQEPKNLSTASFIFATVIGKKRMLVVDTMMPKYYKDISKNIDVSNTLEGVNVKNYEIIVMVEEGGILRDDALTKIAQLLLSDNYSDSIITSALTIKSGNEVKTLIKPDKQLIKLPLLKMHAGFYAFRVSMLPNEFRFSANNTLLNSFHYLFVLLSSSNANKYFKSIPIPLCTINLESPGEKKFSIIKYSEYESIIYKDLMKNFGLNFSKNNGSVVLKPCLIKDVGIKTVAVIVPFKNQLKMTIDAIKSIRKTMPSAMIIAVDNNSDKLHELNEVRSIVDEYILADFPYNYSKIHNHAYEKSELIKSSEYIIFMNNDVIINDYKINNLLSWFTFAEVSAVGCKLLYPSGEVQFGGVGRSRYNQIGNHGWYHIDQHLRKSDADVSNLTYSAHSLTCAFVIVKLKSYIDVNGFDSIMTPIGFSDAKLFMKIRSNNNILIYDGTHDGIHYESVSRGVSYNDDLEAYESDSILSDNHSNLTVEIH